MRGKGIVVIGVGITLAVAGFVAWWARAEPEASAAGSAQNAAVAEAPALAPTRATEAVSGESTVKQAPPPAVTEARASSNTPASDSVPMDLPLRDTIAELDRRARSGDAAAACRLGAELLRCERARTLQPYTDNVEAQARALAQRSLAAPEMDRQIDAALQRQQENAAALARCEGVDGEQWPPAARYFNLAAQAGHRPSMVQFLNAERFRSDQLFRDPELIALFRANAPRYFMTLLEAGDPEVLQRLAMSAGMPYDILQSVLPPPYDDPGFAAAMQRQSLLARGIDPPEVPLRDPPTPEQLAEAERVYARYFAGHRPDEADLQRRMATSPYDLAQYRCDETAR